MCIILDANCQSDFVNRHDDMKPIHNWIDNRGGRIAYSATGRFQEESTGIFIKKLRELSRAGKTKLIDSGKVEEKQHALPELESDDSHIIAMALVANVKILVSRDEALHKDFKNIARGKVYQNAGHKRLLKPDTCP